MTTPRRNSFYFRVNYTFKSIYNFAYRVTCSHNETLYKGIQTFSVRYLHSHNIIRASTHGWSLLASWEWSCALRPRWRHYVFAFTYVHAFSVFRDSYVVYKVVSDSTLVLECLGIVQCNGYLRLRDQVFFS